MIKFFRKIRQQLITENRFSKYLLYATGEILLVVIGILIAVQINSWNTELEVRKLEISTLQEMRQNLVQDTLVISSNLEDLEEKRKQTRELIEHVENKKPYSPRLDSLQMGAYYHRGYDTFNTAAFELLKERGYDIIQNSELRQRITVHYTTDLSDVRGILSRLDKLNLLQAENMYDHFSIRGGIVRAYDYQKVLETPEVFGPFYHFETMTNAYFGNLNDYNLKIKGLLEALDTELQKEY